MANALCAGDASESSGKGRGDRLVMSALGTGRRGSCVCHTLAAGRRHSQPLPLRAAVTACAGRPRARRAAHRPRSTVPTSAGAGPRSTESTPSSLTFHAGSSSLATEKAIKIPLASRIHFDTTSLTSQPLPDFTSHHQRPGPAGWGPTCLAGPRLAAWGSGSGAAAGPCQPEEGHPHPPPARAHSQPWQHRGAETLSTQHGTPPRGQPGPERAVVWRRSHSIQSASSSAASRGAPLPLPRAGPRAHSGAPAPARD